MMLRPILCALIMLGLLTACEFTADPRTGERQTQVTVPLTEAHERRLKRRWLECTRFRGKGFCDRKFGGLRPQATAAPETAN